MNPTDLLSGKEITRFWSKVDKNSSPEGCWLWTGPYIKKAYGWYWSGVLETLAHRVSYMFVHGEIPEGLYICHKCDVPACVNPDHLFLGTQKDNAQDSLRKGRHWADDPEKALAVAESIRQTRKERNYPAWNKSLSDEQVRLIRALYIPNTYGFGAVSIANALGLSEAIVSGVCTGGNYSKIKCTLSKEERIILRNKYNLCTPSHYIKDPLTGRFMPRKQSNEAP